MSQSGDANSIYLNIFIAFLVISLLVWLWIIFKNWTIFKNYMFGQSGAKSSDPYIHDPSRYAPDGPVSNMMPPMAPHVAQPAPQSYASYVNKVSIGEGHKLSIGCDTNKKIFASNFWYGAGAGGAKTCGDYVTMPGIDGRNTYDFGPDFNAQIGRDTCPGHVKHLSFDYSCMND